jgi:hypothetical protein
VLARCAWRGQEIQALRRAGLLEVPQIMAQDLEAVRVAAVVCPNHASHANSLFNARAGGYEYPPIG